MITVLPRNRQRLSALGCLERLRSRLLSRAAHRRHHRTHLIALFAVLLGLCGVSPMAAAASSACPAFFAGGQAPDVLRMEQVPRTHTLCFRFYAAMASGITRTPLWSAEHLTRDSVALAQTQQRHDAFHAEMSLLADDRAELEDYRASGFDRGHMAPSGDMPDAAAQEQSFSLANMAPQDANNNRHLWQGIEITTRAMAKSSGALYVVTGPAFLGAPTWMHSRVAVPNYFWKAIYDPTRGAAAYITVNRDGDDYAVISIAMLQRITGIDPFPGVADAVKANAIALPPPRPSGQRMKSGPVTPSALGLVFPADGGPAQTTLGPTQPSAKGAQQAARAEKREARVAAGTTTAKHSGDTHKRRAAKKQDKPAGKHPRGAQKEQGVYGYGYQLGKTLKQLGNDIGVHTK